MAKLTFNSVVYLKSTLEKCYVRAVITMGQDKKYRLSNGTTVRIEDILTELPMVDVEPVVFELVTAPKTKSKPKKTDKC